MKKKLLSLLLALCMVLTLAPAALADEETGEEPPTTAPATSTAPAEEPRDTNFFTDVPHADMDWEDMEYIPVDGDEFLAAIDQVEALIGTSANAVTVEELFKNVADMYMTIRANISWLNIQLSLDYANTEYSDAYDAEYDLYLDIFDPFIFLVKDILNSPCKDYFVEQEKLTQDDIDSYLEYGGMTDEQKELQSQIATLENSYDAVAATCPDSVEIDGVVWTEESLDAAYTAEEITDEEYITILNALIDAEYSPLGELYMQLLDLNTQLAATYDYDNYSEFSYVEEYGRDYTAEEIAAFCEAVREYYVPLRYILSQSVDEEGKNNFVIQETVNDLFFQDPVAYNMVMTTDFTTDEVLAMVEPYIGKMSDELLEAYDYMLEHGLYDIAPDEKKGEGGFTTVISRYGSPFFFNNPYGYYADFSTIIHEFGHYDNFYWHPSGWNDGSCSIDVAEVHSQALELLFLQFYEDILGSASTFMAEETVSNILGGAMVQGALIGELENYAGSTEDVTLEDICDKYAQLLMDYGMTDNEMVAQINRYGWLEIHHVIEQPMYYISYATSASGAFAFWLEAQSDGYEAATDHYLEFVSQSVYTPFLEQFENAGVDNPLTPEYVKAVSEAINEYFDLEARYNEILNPTPTFSDVPFDDSYNTLVEFAHSIGAIDGDGSGSFHPNDATNRAQVVQALYSVFGKYLPASGEASPFADITGTEWYAEAANWAYEYGIITGISENDLLTFNGGSGVTREMMATIIYKVATLFYGPQTPEDQPYTDAASISPWAVEAINWLTEVGMLSPVDDAGNINPQAAMNRLNLASYAVNLFQTIFA